MHSLLVAQTAFDMFSCPASEIKYVYARWLMLMAFLHGHFLCNTNLYCDRGHSKTESENYPHEL